MTPNNEPSTAGHEWSLAMCCTCGWTCGNNDATKDECKAAQRQHVIEVNKAAGAASTETSFRGYVSFGCGRHPANATGASAYNIDCIECQRQPKVAWFDGETPKQASTDTAEQIADRFGFGRNGVVNRAECVAAITEATARYVHCPKGHLCYSSAEGTVVCEACRLQAERDAFDKEMVIAQTDLAAERAQNVGLREALRGLGKVKQFPNELCWCRTGDGMYCVGQPQCRAAQEALLSAPVAPAQAPSAEGKEQGNG